MFELRQAFEWLDSAVMYGRGEESFSGVSTDSRQIDPGSLYVPLRGERFDGHQFIDDVRARQAGGYLFESVDRIVPPAVQVPDTRRALGELARGWRAQFALPVLAVLGSNAKTTVKEMLASILVEALGEQAGLATHGNLNNDIGVPLTLFRLRAEHRALVVELGMNHVGEISWLAEMARPTVAVVTNAQREHQEYLDSVAATARENGQAFAWLPADGVAVFPGDDECADIWQQQAGTRRTIRFGYDISFEVWADSDSDPTGFEMHIDGLGQMVNLRIDGQHNVRNAMAAAATAFPAGFDAGVILRGLSQFTPAATITPQHLLYNRNAIFSGGLRPHWYCLPVLKREHHRLALVEAATSGSERFFLGTDSAPHAAILKEHARGCAGCYSAPYAMALYATAFDRAGRLDRLEAFASLNGPAFYGLPVNENKVSLRRQTSEIAPSLPFGDQTIVPLGGGESIDWVFESQPS